MFIEHFIVLYLAHLAGRTEQSTGQDRRNSVPWGASVLVEGARLKLNSVSR